MAIWKKLADYFPASEIKWKAQSVKGNRCLAIAYLTSRVVMDRLDEVVGCENWRDDYTVLPNDSVVCRLEVFDGTQWIYKTDVGSPSEQPDEGDRTKAAFSDALKRAAVKFGIGRYLARFPHQWVDYDPAKRSISGPCAIPPQYLNDEDRAKINLPKAPPKQQQQPQKQQTAQEAAVQAMNPPPGQLPAVTEVRYLLYELAKVRKIDPGTMFKIFTDAFAPGLKKFDDLPPERLLEAAKQLRFKINNEKAVDFATQS